MSETTEAVISSMKWRMREQLRALTNWEDTPNVIRKYSLARKPMVLPRPPEGMETAVLSGDVEWEQPHYNAAYLLDKLKDESVALRFVSEHNLMAMDLKEWRNNWIAYTPYMPQKDFPYSSDPDLTVLDLALYIVKQQTLTHKPQD